MPKAETPSRLLRFIAANSHHAAVHEGSERRNFGRQIEQRIPPLPDTSREQSEGTTVVEGAVEMSA
jgi:hypothetical protein